MIQRIQSFYLVLAVCAFALCFMFPVASFEATGEGSETKVVSQLNLISRADAGESDMLRQVEMGESLVTMPQRGVVSMWPMAALAAVAGLLSLFSIFLFKKRMVQVRVVAFAFLLNVVYLFILFIGPVDKFAEQVGRIGSMVQAEQVDITYSVATWAAVASLLLLYLAQRAIKRDEAKVRAADRLR